MIRLRNRVTGVVVVVDDATAATLGGHFERIDAEKPAPEPKKAPARKRAAKK